MVEHTVWFKLKEGITQEEKSELKASLLALPGAIPEIKYMACGEDFSGRAGGYDFGLIVRFEDRAAHDEVYQPHPAHQQFIQGCRHLWTEVKALDFEY